LGRDHLDNNKLRFRTQGSTKYDLLKGIRRIGGGGDGGPDTLL
jgi:hypothetical protein